MSYLRYLCLLEGGVMSYLRYLCLFEGGLIPYLRCLCLFEGGLIPYLRCLCLFEGGLMSYLRYLCLFAYSGIQHILCCVFVLFFFRVVYLMLSVSLDCPYWYSLTFIQSRI
jgi:hypothetical protein